MLLLTEIAPDLWTATQPLSFLGLEVGCRMTIVRLPSHDLVVISPIELRAGDLHAIDSLGTVRYLVAPNLFHHLFLDRAQRFYPTAKTLGPADLAKKRPDLKIDAALDQPGSFESVLDYLPFKGFAAILPTGIQSAQETVFYHRPSKTLILTDTAFNFDESFPFTTRLAAQVLGSYQSLRPTRMEKWGTRDKQAVEASVRKVLNWDFDRVIPGHGTIIETAGKLAFTQGYEWFLERSLNTAARSRKRPTIPG